MRIPEPGAPVRRTEDRRFLTGRGRFLDDTVPAGECRAHVVRSPHAHARILALDWVEAARVPGVLAVFTAADLDGDGLGHLRPQAMITDRTGAPARPPPRPALAAGKVRHVGDGLALVVAETDTAARDAAERVRVEYEPLASVADAERALAPEAPLVWGERPGNLFVDFEAGDPDAVAEAFAGAAHVTRLDVLNNRVSAQPMEPRGAIGLYDAEAHAFTLIAATQNVHAIRAQLAREVLGVDEGCLRVVAPDVGGGFGARNQLYPEMALVLFAARRLGRPVKWIADRSEGFVADVLGRDQINRLELALDSNGRFLGLRIETIGNVGAYVSTFGPHVPTAGTARLLGGVYRIPAVYFRSRIAFTNVAPVDSYRGAGKPEAAYMIERIVDAAAIETGCDRVQLRRANLIPVNALPYRTAMGEEIDSGDFAGVLEGALAKSDWRGFAVRAEHARTRGRMRGIGLALYLACTSGPPREYAALRFAADGTVEIRMGSQSTGMGHETTLPQIAAGLLGIPFEAISYAHGDTALTPMGSGHGGARTLELGGGALAKAASAAVGKARAIAAHLLGVVPETLAFREGRFVGPNGGSVPMTEVIGASFDAGRVPDALAGSLDSSAEHEREDTTYANGCHVAEVEVDPETGVVRLVAYTALDDFGRIVNPLTAAGQIVGAAAQGIGQALLEVARFDPVTGQPLAATFLDYAIPRADDFPAFATAFHADAPTVRNPLGVKGAGEAGCVAAPPAVVNAVVHALRRFGVLQLDMPLTPETVWRTIVRARSGAGRTPRPEAGSSSAGSGNGTRS
ncbi:MAG: xanthine dehydrogenase family protein molybdopterin-binding subunit [Rhodospirillales bacterium]|nr:xanthine dehydrogenase family protein molybdopterin-binding subunit [Rhodospirillales bacterium]